MPAEEALSFGWEKEERAFKVKKKKALHVFGIYSASFLKNLCMFCRKDMQN